MNISKLRFPEFVGEWEMKKLGEVAKFSKGKGISKADIVDDGENECIRYGELYTFYGETIKEIKSRTNIAIKDLVLSAANDVIIPASGETQIDIATASCVLKSGIALGGDLNIIKTKNNGVFLSYYLNSKKKLEIACLAQGISVVHLYSSQLSLLNLNLPNLPEQTKIATFLTSVDEKLTQLKKKKSLLEKYKKGVMQKLFSQELRFKDENGADFAEWEEKTLGELEIYVSDGNYGELYPRADQMVSQGVPFIRANNIKNLRLTMQDMKFIEPKHHEILTSGHLKTGDILVTTRGDIGMLAYVSEDFNNSNINAQICLLRVSKKLNSIYLLNFLSSRWGVTQFKSMQTGSALKQLPKSSLAKVLIKLPSLVEQTKIANFLSAIDDKINQCGVQIEKMEGWKKGLLQQMFV
ncbi:MAG: restriction endonuclease subunit S [Paludibacter sp.]